MTRCVTDEDHEVRASLSPIQSRRHVECTTNVFRGISSSTCPFRVHLLFASFNVAGESCDIQLPGIPKVSIGDEGNAKVSFLVVLFMHHFLDGVDDARDVRLSGGNE